MNMNGENLGLAKLELREEIMVELPTPPPPRTEIWTFSESESNLSRDLNHMPFYSPSRRP